MLPFRLAAFAAASIVCSGFAWAQDAGPGAAHAYAAPSGERASDRWTPEAMKNVAPKALPEVDPATVRSAGHTRAAPGKSAVSQPADMKQGANERRSGDIGTRPLYWSGRLFADDADGNGYSCSAQFISDDVLITAAQCVRDNKTGDFAQNVEFYLGYDRGDYVRRYTTNCMWTYDGWVSTDPSRYLYDYAMIKVNGTSATGHWGTHRNWLGAYQRATKIGYPKGDREGEVIQVDRGPVHVADGIVALRHGNKADPHGSAGGAFVGDYTKRDGDHNYVISVDSFTYTGERGTDYGPYFDDYMKKLWDKAEGPCN